MGVASACVVFHTSPSEVQAPPVAPRRSAFRELLKTYQYRSTIDRHKKAVVSHELVGPREGLPGHSSKALGLEDVPAVR